MVTMSFDKDKSYTFADYASWDAEYKYELLDGMPVMQPRPDLEHQRIEGALIQQLRNYLDGKPGVAFPESEVLLLDSPEQKPNDARNVFVPDIIVVCEPQKIKKQYCLGAPTVVMEVVSPATVKNDRLVKLSHYQKAGVMEYWIVSPQEQNVSVYMLRDGGYHIMAVYTKEDTEAPVLSLEGCVLNMAKIFPA